MELTGLEPVDQLAKGALVPLGWYLSRNPRKALATATDCLVLEIDGKPDNQQPCGAGEAREAQCKRDAAAA